MGVSAQEQDDYNLTDSAFFGKADPDDILRKYRQDDPVHWTVGRYNRGFWSVTRHRDGRAVYENDAVFSSARSGPMLPISTDYETPVEGDLLALQLAGAQISAMDGPAHGVMRRAFSVRFMQPSVAKLEGTIRALAVECFNRVLPKGECDFAFDVAGSLPLMLISHIMDLPPAVWPDIYRWTYMSTSPDDPEFSIGTPEETSRVGTGKVMAYCLKLALERREKPGDDLLSDIALTEIDGKKLADMVVAFNAAAFIAAGHETTRNALCGALAELVAHPAELAKLRALRHNPAALRLAVEEAVRWTSPLTHQLRTATQDVELGGKRVKAGDWVVIWNNAANRDADVFADPYRFDIARSPNPHLGFAYGPHFCLGANLARLELRIMFELLLEHLHDIELAAPPQYTASMILRGIKHMPLKFKPVAPIAS
ncbi:MAG TPA: cytochrome P450 [Rhizomicrobium sp.]